LLAKNAVRYPPPLGLWERFVLEKHGEHRGQFDVKLRAMKPVVDAARVLALDTGIHATTGTVDRLMRLSASDSSIARVFPEVSMAFELFLRYRIQYGMSHRDSGRYLDLAGLRKLERGMLRNAFLPVKSLATLVRVRYQLDSLGLG
jgi:CBS domain-containing protein